MTTAYYCVLAVYLLSYVFTVLAKAGHPEFDNHYPRLFMNKLTGWRHRCAAASMNTLENFPAFAAAIIIAHLVNKPQHSVDILALAYVATRVLYGIWYAIDYAMLRSLTWFAGFGIIIALFF